MYCYIYCYMYVHIWICVCMCRHLHVYVCGGGQYFDTYTWPNEINSHTYTQHLYAGLSFESDIHHDIVMAMEKVAEFIAPPGETIPAIRDVPFHYHNRCDLATELYNYKELECVFGPTALSWVVHETKNKLNFESIMASGDEFLAYVVQQKERDNDIMNPRVCRVPANLTMLNEYKMKLTKVRGRCGHGGHKKVRIGATNWDIVILMMIMNGSVSRKKINGNRCYVGCSVCNRCVVDMEKPKILYVATYSV